MALLSAITVRALFRVLPSPMHRFAQMPAVLLGEGRPWIAQVNVCVRGLAEYFKVLEPDGSIK